MINSSTSQISIFQSFAFTLQWHLTTKCSQNCMHCYIGREDDDYQIETRNELDTEACTKIIDNYLESFSSWGVPLRISFTGGDPLLKKDFFEIAKYAKQRNISIGILGNPNFLDISTAKELKKIGIDTYQLSLDGCEKTHDMLRRREGLFNETIKAIRTLNDVGIKSVIMYTLHKLNAEEIIDVIQKVSDEGVSIFDFARLVPIGNAKDLIDYMLEPYEYRNLLLRIFWKYLELQRKGTKTKFGRKDHLWNLLYKELGLYYAIDSKLISGGCGIGWQHLTVLADGTVLACRRLPVKIGKVPKQNFQEIFLNSNDLTLLRDYEKLEKCGNCDLINICRGCPGVAFGATGNYYSPDPQCWKR